MPLDLSMMLGKLSQLEEQAQLSVDEHAKGMGVERQKLVLALTRFLKAHVQGVVSEERRRPSDPRSN
jgi:hypothetical protein